MNQENPSKLQRGWLRVFWSKCGVDGHKWYISCVGKRETIEMLQLLGTVVTGCKVSKVPLAKKRMKFDKIKSTRHQFKSHKNCFACRGLGEVRHHIIWLKHGGLNSKKNIVTLCRPCHAEIHPWLK